MNYKKNNSLREAVLKNKPVEKKNEKQFISFSEFSKEEILHNILTIFLYKINNIF